MDPFKSVANIKEDHGFLSGKISSGSSEEQSEISSTENCELSFDDEYENDTGRVDKTSKIKDLSKRWALLAKRIPGNIVSFLFPTRNYNNTESNSADTVPVVLTTTTPGNLQSSGDTAIQAIRPGIPMIAMDTQRGYGILMVIAYHLGYDFAKNFWWFISLFFSLSGFLITKTTVEAFERRGRVDILKFWAKRVSRLFPALLLAVNAIVLSQKLPYRQNHHNDGIRFQREAVDLVYATVFATNINLVFNQVDDYFDEFTPPSITRHLWTLSIEEQYYIIWPLVVWCIVKFTVGGRDNISKAYEKKSYMKAILVMDVFVMVGSVFSSLITIDRMGLSAAYFSTLCRMGDIALGAAVYSSARLWPWTDDRMRAAYTNDDGVVVRAPPLTLQQQVVLELLACISICFYIILALIRTPLDRMLYLYFQGTRFLGVLVSISTVAVCILAADGPLPWWAVSSRFWSSKTLAFMGVMSYGAYVYHWPIIVFFGDPMSAHRKQVAMGLLDDDGTDDHFVRRDAILVVVIMVLGYLSFVFYEMPVLLLSRRTKPVTKTILAGFAGMGVTLFVIWAVTHDLPPRETFENDAGDLFLGQNQYNGITDDRFTPVLTDIASTSFYNILDYDTRSVHHITNGKGYKEFPDKYPDYQPGGTFGANATVILSCPSKDSDVDFEWVEPTYWVWLLSDFCDPSTLDQAGVIDNDVDGLVQVEIFHDMKEGEHDGDTNEDLDHQQRIIKQEETARHIILAVDDALPGVLNQASVAMVRSDLERGETRDGGEPWDPITMTVIGESVAERIGMFWVRTKQRNVQSTTL